MGEEASDITAARSRLLTVAAASAYRELVAAAAAWNCGGCVCPSAAGREAEGRGGEGCPALGLGLGLRALPGSPLARGPGAFPALLWGPYISPPPVSAKRDVQGDSGLLTGFLRPGLSAQGCLPNFPSQNVSRNPV